MKKISHLNLYLSTAVLTLGVMLAGSSVGWCTSNQEEEFQDFSSSQEGRTPVTVVIVPSDTEEKPKLLIGTLASGKTGGENSQKTDTRHLKESQNAKSTSIIRPSNEDRTEKTLPSSSPAPGKKVKWGWFSGWFGGTGEITAGGSPVQTSSTDGLTAATTSSSSSEKESISLDSLNKLEETLRNKRTESTQGSSLSSPPSEEKSKGFFGWLYGGTYKQKEFDNLPCAADVGHGKGQGEKDTNDEQKTFLNQPSTQSLLLIHDLFKSKTLTLGDSKLSTTAVIQDEATQNILKLKEGLKVWAKQGDQLVTYESNKVEQKGEAHTLSFRGLFITDQRGQILYPMTLHDKTFQVFQSVEVEGQKYQGLFVNGSSQVLPIYDGLFYQIVEGNRYQGSELLEKNIQNSIVKVVYGKNGKKIVWSNTEIED